MKSLNPHCIVYFEIVNENLSTDYSWNNEKEVYYWNDSHPTPPEQYEINNVVERELKKGLYHKANILFSHTNGEKSRKYFNSDEEMMTWYESNLRLFKYLVI